MQFTITITDSKDGAELNVKMVSKEEGETADTSNAAALVGGILEFLDLAEEESKKSVILQ